MQDAARLRAARELGRVGPGVGEHGRVDDRGREGVSPALAPTRAPVIAHDAHQDVEHPRLDRAASLELTETPVHRDEDLLRDVVARAVADPETTNRAPDEGKCFLVHLFERRTHEPYGRALGALGSIVDLTGKSDSARQS